MSHGPDINPVLDAMPGRTLPSALKAASGIGILWGVIALGYGFGTGKTAWTMGAILVSLIWIMGMSQGGMLFAIVHTGTWARWGRSLKRIGEAMAVFLPVAYALLLVFLVLGGTKIYVWNPETIIEGGPISIEPHNPEAPAAKPFWLQNGFFIARQAIGLGILIALDFVYMRASFGADIALAKERLGDKIGGPLYGLFSTSSDATEAREKGQATQSSIFPFIVLAYALSFSLVAFDLIMSLDPWWFTNMFGGWVFMSSFWTGLCCIGLIAMLSRDWLNLGDFIKPNVTHDLGKLMLAGCMFWAYTLYAQLLPIWYANMPEETGFILVRLTLPQWSWLSQTVAVMCFLAPFTMLLSRGVKKMRWPFAGICAFILVGMFLERSLLVMPSVHLGDTFPMADFLIINVGIAAGVAGLFALCTGYVLAKFPPLVVNDPYLEPHPWDAHYHSLDAHSH